MKLNYFNFKRFGDKVLLTNDFGKYMFLEMKDFKKVLRGSVDKDSELGNNLVNAKMMYHESDLDFTSKNRYFERDFKRYMNFATALHIFVVTTACNMACVYCQANNGKQNTSLYMNREIATKAVDIALQSPNKCLTFEFQGGEPLLNFEIIKYIVEYAESRKKNHIIEYTIVSNLTLLTDEMVDFFVQYKVGVSTSVDGNEELHNKNRPFKDGSKTYEKVITSIKKLRDRDLHVGAIETTTRHTLRHPEELVETYVNMGFDSIFIRPLTPLGKATIGWEKIGYSAEEFVGFYEKVLMELLEINKRGIFIKENHASIFLNKISGESVNYMELRSPCGAGVGQLAYYADGNVFTCDEGRMLYEMGQDTFCLGNVFEDTYVELVDNGTCRTVCASSILETIPSCCDCVYQPYCGTCPVVNYALDQDVIEKHPRGYRCVVYSGMLDCLFKILMENEEQNIKILSAWMN